MDLTDAQDTELQRLVTGDESVGPEKGNFVRLAHFPSDVLAIINLHVSGLDLLRILSCGSKLLYYKLTKMRGATQFRIASGIDHFLRHADWRNRSFEAMSAFEGLRCVEFLGFYNKSFRHFTTAKLENLPPTIEVLRFDFLEALTMWIDLSQRQWEHLEDGTTVFHAKSIIWTRNSPI